MCHPTGEGITGPPGITLQLPCPTGTQKIHLPPSDRANGLFDNCRPVLAGRSRYECSSQYPVAYLRRFYFGDDKPISARCVHITQHHTRFPSEVIMFIALAAAVIAIVVIFTTVVGKLTAFYHRVFDTLTHEEN
jgi:hypothetical protein